MSNLFKVGKEKIRLVRRILLKWLRDNSLTRLISLLNRFANGMKTYLSEGHTPPVSYYAMRELYAYTDGHLNNLMALCFELYYSSYKIINYKGILGDLDRNQIGKISKQTEKDGYSILPVKLPESVVSDILDFAATIPCFSDSSYPEKLISFREAYSHDSVNSFENPTYWINNQSLLEHQPVQDIVFDETFLLLAQVYLGCKPILCLVSCWWSVPLNREPEFGSAQFYHYDMGRLKCVRFFFYLTDVTSKNGSHCYVKSSHRSKPKVLRPDGRKTDNEISQHYSEEQCVEICGEAGTIIMQDPSGFHKGKALEAGYRLILQLVYSVSLFGSDYERIHISMCKDKSKKMMRAYPETYTLFSHND
ncbi:hypothetical protein GlitD10_2572 [Gloeomargarita lithophora Alchichica-D10]|uniref:Phytanoyl-CoA dioxygenase (PhyH) n=1 Tax=Gloeomargarita lithophora Alchichica-D10 TaxID=1188229 RepID=A0A1J0AG51_9CYAN|nr:phytanoyl-CoA dioxygenase family protein [Gloeomargarita lithophora]APB34913.1 hypothetical protein GlitD10_2572 [Gloeomargarita lithophora Alchichica-D10]